MRVGLVCPYSLRVPGGVQNQVLGLARWLKQAGHGVGVLAPEARSSLLTSEYGLRPDEVADAGQSVALGYNGSVARVNMGLAPWLLVRRWVARFDVVHVHEPVTPSVALLVTWAAARSGVPVVATCHAAVDDDAGVLGWLAGHVPGLAGVACLTAVSATAAATARRRTGREPVVIGNAIDVAGLEAAAGPVVAGRWRGGVAPRLGFVGRIDEPRKGFDELMAAWPVLRALCPDMELVVVGPGHPRPAPGVRYLGAVPDAERDRVLGACDVFVAPHRGQESFGIVLVEALAAGAAVVASDIPAFADVLAGCASSVLVAPGDAQALVRGVRTALALPDRGAAAAQGRARAGAFDWSVIGPAYLRAYQSVLDVE